MAITKVLDRARAPAEVDEAYGFGHTQPESPPAEADREAGE